MEQLVKGQNFIITEKKPFISIEWEAIQNKQIDILVFQLVKEKLKSEKDFIYFNNFKSEAILLSTKNNLAKIELDILKLRGDIDKILIVASIDGKFEELSKISLTIGNKVYNIKAGVENALNIAEIYQRNGQWKFKAIGQGYISGLERIAEKCGLDLSELSEEARKQKFRRSSKDVISKYMEKIESEIEKFKQNIDNAVLVKYNESDTRMLIDKIFVDALGYKIDEVKTEQRIQGRKADYILSVDGNDHVVVEAKKAGMPLRNKQVFQATSYGAYSGIKWALLTNLLEWQLYYINSGDIIEPELVFSVNLETIHQEDIAHLFSISRYGITRKGILSKTLDKSRALSQSNIIFTILSNDVVAKVRSVVNRSSSYKTSDEEVQAVLEELLNI